MLETKTTLHALSIAKAAHAGQKDKAGKPYIEHPLHIANLMSTEEEACVALLHDVVEDSDWTIDDLAKEGFSKEVLNAVEALTHDNEVAYFDYIASIRENPLAVKIKIADLRHNSDISRIPQPTEKDFKRIVKYTKALGMLEGN